MIRKFVFSLLLILLATKPIFAQGTTLNVAFFYSPTCPHCHTVFQEILPPLMAEYGEQLNVIQVDVTHPDGQALYQEAIRTFNISSERRGVPTMVVNNTVLVGQDEVAAQLPMLLAQGAEAGGIAAPAIEGLRSISADTVSTGTGNALTFLTLLGLFGALGIVGVRYVKLRPIRWKEIRPKTTPIIPILIAIGLTIAGYLTVVALTQSDAVCGAVGDCNAVQASQFSKLFGIPVALLGFLTYALLLGLWAWQRYMPQKRGDVGQIGVLAVTTVGVLFSIYLMSVSLFVIQATCLWCVGSALTLTALLLIEGFTLLREPEQKTRPRTKRGFRRRTV